MIERLTAVMDALTAAEPLTLRQITETIGTRESQARWAIVRLRSDKKIYISGWHAFVRKGVRYTPLFCRGGLPDAPHPLGHESSSSLDFDTGRDLSSIITAWRFESDQVIESETGVPKGI